ncbi:hypothetical protein [Solirubrobacter soli]|uniref:hypothetical protein n=1 Tax=Solirubrobacter soli TaxID=363832 RepID=UPI000416144C|nr:hypothetical protein [Solirubrobacter soli]
MTIDEYWRWWQDARADVQAAIEQGADRAVLHEVLDRVSALGLACEMSAGLRSRHAICASANGDPALRKLAYRWRDAGPPADAVFEYHASRIAGNADAVLRMNDREFSFTDFRFGVAVDEPRRELDLDVQHPAFAGMAERERAQVGFIALDTILGEEEVERWIGSLEWSGARPTASVTPLGLREEVARLRASEPSGEWALMRSDDAVAVAARPLRPVDHPYLDLLCELRARPVDHDLSELQDNEEALGREFASRAFHAASLTQGDVRTAFVYIDGDTSTSRELEEWAVERGYATTFSLDPAWDAVRPFR